MAPAVHGIPQPPPEAQPLPSLAAHELTEFTGAWAMRPHHQRLILTRGATATGPCAVGVATGAALANQRGDRFKQKLDALTEKLKRLEWFG